MTNRFCTPVEIGLTLLCNPQYYAAIKRLHNNTFFDANQEINSSIPIKKWFFMKEMHRSTILARTFLLFVVAGAKNLLFRIPLRAIPTGSFGSELRKKQCRLQL